MRRWCRGLGVLAALLGGATFAQDVTPELPNGVFLVAKPELTDPNFAQTVVLVTLPAGGRGAATGVILNRPLGRKLSEFLPDAANLPPEADALYAGGPVERAHLYMLVQAPAAPPASFPVLDDVYLTTSPEALKELMAGRLPGATLRVYAGYAGWAPGQLQAEVARGSWWLVPADAARIFTTQPETLWEELVRAQREKHAGAPPLPASLATMR
ncbi:MAG: YqgE/AlgH family protein [Burkholderiales bacterium]